MGRRGKGWAWYLFWRWYLLIGGDASRCVEHTFCIYWFDAVWLRMGWVDSLLHLWCGLSPQPSQVSASCAGCALACIAIATAMQRTLLPWLCFFPCSDMQYSWCVAAQPIFWSAVQAVTLACMLGGCRTVGQCTLACGWSDIDVHSRVL